MTTSPRFVFLALLLGTVGCLFTGLLAFWLEIFDTRSLAFQCLTVGLVAAAILALMRFEYYRHALILALGFALLQIPAIRHSSFREAGAAVLAALLIGLGLCLTGFIYTLFAEQGLRLGKCLITGPLVGGLFFAVTPIAEFANLHAASAASIVVAEFGVGMIIGHGAGLGLEATELLYHASDGERRRTSRARVDPEKGFRGTFRARPFPRR